MSLLEALAQSTIVSSNIVYLAAATQAAGLVVRTQIVLRLFLLAGSALYLTYYAFGADRPLWEAMAAETVIAAANIYGLAMILLSRSEWLIPAEQMPLYRMFGGLEPGEFRALIGHAHRRVLDAPEVLTAEGQVPASLFYVVAGSVEIAKGASRFTLGPRHFIGEVSLVLDGPASATVTAPAGTDVVEWPRQRLQRAMRNSHRLELSVEALIARDMARKVAIGAGLAIAGEAPPAMADELV